MKFRLHHKVSCFFIWSATISCVVGCESPFVERSRLFDAVLGHSRKIRRLNNHMDRPPLSPAARLVLVRETADLRLSLQRLLDSPKAGLRQIHRDPPFPL